MSKTVLVGAFVRKPRVPERILKNIIENFNTNQIFIFSVDDEQYKRLITFNVNENEYNEKFLEFKKNNKNALRLHRRKESNTFYTINGLNLLVSFQNGSLNDEFKVSWDDYKNCCLLSDREGKLYPLKIKLAKVINY